MLLAACASAPEAPPAEPETGGGAVQGHVCEVERDCAAGLACRFGGKKDRQCLRPTSAPFDFSRCRGEPIDGFADRQVDCGRFVVDNKSEGGDACLVPRIENGEPCLQVIVGRFLQTGGYLGCTAHYIVLNRDDWTEEVNDDFIYCAATAQLGATCEEGIRLVSGQRYVQDFGTQGAPVTARELCQFDAMGCTIEEWEFVGGAVIKCPTGN